MAREKAKKWLSVVAGLALPAAGVVVADGWAAGPPDAGRGADVRVCQLLPRPRASTALNDAIDSYRKGDYEAAAQGFKVAQAGAADLTPLQQQELDQFTKLNDDALKRRTEAAELVRQAEKVEREGRGPVAVDLAQKAVANQFIAPADKQKAQEILGRGRGLPAGVAAGAAPGAAAPAPAKAQLAQARKLFTDGDLDGAEKLAREADRAGYVAAPTEDSPRKLLAEIVKTRQDPGALLTLSRNALTRGDFDGAEKLAKASKAVEPIYSVHLWGDSPSNVLHDIQVAREKKIAADKEAAKKGPNGARQQDAVTAKAVADEKNQTVAKKPDVPPPPPAPDNAKLTQATDQARQLLQQGRKALKDGQIEKAEDCAHKADALKPNLGWWEDDTPAKLLADMHAAKAAKAGTAKADAKATSNDPRALLRDAHKAYDEGKYDEAITLAQKAKTAPGAKDCWGLFDFDTPDKLITEVNKARQKRNEQEADKLLTEGRKLLDQAQKDDAHRGELLDQAQKAALKADTLRNGNYSIWEMGDRPSKLLADIDAERKKGRTKTVPPVPPIGSAVAENNGAGRWAAGAPDDAKMQQARKLMNEARQAARAGNTTAAMAAIDTVEQMHLPADKLGSDSPAAVRRELALASPGNATPPAPTVGVGTAPAPAGRNGNGQARALVAEARQLQQENRLLEARARLLEAQKLPAAFGPDEDRPEKALLDLAGLARRQIDRLETQADDAVHSGNPQKFGEAEEKLTQAQALARGFQLDTYLLDKKLAWVKQTRGATVAQGNTGSNAATQIQRVEGRSNVTDGGPQAQGEQLLSQARMEIRAGNLGPARRLVEQVYAGNFGLKTEAESLLRSIDVEEYEQQRNQQKRTYEAGHSAFMRGDYQLAGQLLRAVDFRMLNPDQQAQMKELMRDPHLQPEQVVAAQGPGSGGAVAPPGSGSDHVDDSRETTYLQQVDAMRQIKFQKMREQELDSEKRAHRLADLGDTEQAIGVLQEYLSRLPESGLDPDKTALLRRPVEAKLQQYQTLDAQKKIKTAEKNAVNQAKYNHEQKNVAEENKQQRIKELMDKYNGLYKQAKYRDAEMYAMQAQELDPDNPVAAAAVQMARTQGNIQRFKQVREGKEQHFVDDLDDAEDMGPVVGLYTPFKYDKNHMHELFKHGKYELKAIGGLKTEKEREIESRLDTPVSLNFNNVPLGKVFDDIATMQEINILPDIPSLDEKGISLQQPMTFHLDNIKLKSALKNLLNQVHLTYVIEDDVLKITTPENSRGKLVLVPYQVTELVIPVPDGTSSPMLPSQISQLPNSPYTPGQQGTASPVTGPFSMGNGQAVGSPGGPGTGVAGGNWDVKKAVGGTKEDQLIQLIQNTISPRSWSSMGGQGTIDYFPLTMTLVINQTTDIQEQIADLLAALRRLQDAEVAVEIRLISIAEGFYERIGVDFNVNIVNNKGTQKFQPEIISGQFQPAGFINNFTPDHFLSGLTPAGTFTSDLGIPIRNSSFGMAIPPFGGFPNVPGGNGGIELGLAFLSDIQVFMFLEAAQGDQRTNVMQAPKVTLFNGQLATLSVSDQQFFVTSASVTVVNGQPVFIPNNQAFPTGAQINVQAVISADRRFVRLNFSGTPVTAGGNGGAGGGIVLTNLSSAIVPLFPIVQLVPTVLDGGITTNPVAFTQFFQQPVFNTLSVVTTVMVPDGGTVLMGGFKRLSEGRNEFGPPVLSKIPYLDRLFRNVGYGREVENLMMMVTPRVIINEEEEARQTGVEPVRQAGP